MSPEGSDPARDVEIVGVVGGIHENIVGQGVEPHLYLPFGQRYQSDLNFHLKIAAMGGDAETRLLDAVRREIRAEDNKLPVLNFRTMKQHMEGSMDLWIVRTGATMFTIFGAVAMFLAVIGLYGLKAYTVAQRTREIGIRMAIGAKGRDILTQFLIEALALSIGGGAIGVALGIGASRLLAWKAHWPILLSPAAVALAFGFSAAIGVFFGFYPARKASQLDPIDALRFE
jgi:putative ABC transport system permease protein